MQPDPWKEIEDKFQDGQVVSGTVRKIQSFGAFVQIYPGVDALLPTVEMSGYTERQAGRSSASRSASQSNHQEVLS